MAEWLKALVSKTSIGETQSGVQISLSPQLGLLLRSYRETGMGGRKTTALARSFLLSHYSN